MGKILRCGLILAFVTLLSGVSFAQPGNPPLMGGNQSQKTGALYTGDRVPGDPRNGVAQLQRIFKFIQIYKARHQGNDATEQGDVTYDIVTHFQDYGFRNVDEALKSLANEDNQYADMFHAWRHIQLTQSPAMGIARADNTLFGTPREPGTVDVLAFSDIYYHRNDPNPLQGHRVPNPLGFYLVLCDDGTVAKIPYDEVEFVYRKFNPVTREITLRTVFPGEAGVPYNCLTYAESHMIFAPSLPPLLGYRIPFGRADPTPDNGAFESLVLLSRLLQKPLERQDVWNAFPAHELEFTLREAQQSAAKLGLPLQLTKMTLDELEQHNAPAIFMTSDDKQLVTLYNLDATAAIMVDRGMTRIVSRASLTQRYGGEALLAPATIATPANIRVTEPVRLVTLTSATQEVTQQVEIANNGTQPLTLQVEHPIPGCAQADLSLTQLKPSQKATLTLRLRWREALQVPTQNIVVLLRTSDPARPHMALGFQLSFTPAAPP